MKKLTALFAFVFVIVACTNKRDMSQPRYDIPAVGIDPILQEIDTTNITRTYNEHKNCIEVSYKGEDLTVSYEIQRHSQTKSFIISMVVAKRGIKDVSNMELTIGNSKYLIVPFVVNPISDNMIVVGFGFAEETMRITMELLAYSNSFVEARIHTDNGSFRIHNRDVINLRYMVRSYLLDGGKFE